MSARAVCLVVLDGWGLAPDGPGNAVSLADTPVFDDLWSRHPHTELTTSGSAVGLPDGQMGNSEVGHLNLGAGAVVKQDLTRIGDAIEDGSFAENEVLRAACASGREAGRLHLLGLVSDGGVHASMDHLDALIDLAAAEGVPDVVLHAFTDGRDTAPDSGRGHLERAERKLADSGVGRVGSVSGRYHAMDRDKRWDRTKLAYDAIVHGGAEGREAPSGAEAVAAAYERGETDEFILPDARRRGGARALGRRRRLLQLPPRPRPPAHARAGRAGLRRVRPRRGGRRRSCTTLTEYSEEFGYPVAFPPSRPETTLAATLADQGVTQLHVAETEKYAHVTYFFNGGEEDEYAGRSTAWSTRRATSRRTTRSPR